MAYTDLVSALKTLTIPVAENGWTPVKRCAKNRYLYLLYTSKSEKRKLLQMCKYDLNTEGKE